MMAKINLKTILEFKIIDLCFLTFHFQIKSIELLLYLFINIVIGAPKFAFNTFIFKSKLLKGTQKLKFQTIS